MTNQAQDRAFIIVLNGAVEGVFWNADREEARAAWLASYSATERETLDVDAVIIGEWNEIDAEAIDFASDADKREVVESILALRSHYSGR